MEIQNLHIEQNNAQVGWEQDLLDAFAAAGLNDFTEMAEAAIRYIVDHEYHERRNFIIDDEEESGSDSEPVKVPASLPGAFSGSRSINAKSNTESGSELLSRDAMNTSSIPSYGSSDDEDQREKPKVLSKDSLMLKDKKYQRSYTKVPDERCIRDRNDEFSDRSKATHEFPDKKTSKYQFSGLQHRIANRLNTLGRESQEFKRSRGSGFQTSKKHYKKKEKKNMNIESDGSQLLDRE